MSTDEKHQTIGKLVTEYHEAKREQEVCIYLKLQVNMVSSLFAKLTIVLEIKEANHNLETRLITEFWKWASPVEARARGSRDTLHALELEVDSLKERVRKLEGGQ